MKINNSVILSIVYSIFQISQGLLIHPYQTMQSLVKDKIFVWMTLLPTFFLAMLTMIWKLFLFPLLKIFITCQSVRKEYCDLFYFLAEWVTFFCIYWQIILIYLLVRFNNIKKT